MNLIKKFVLAFAMIMVLAPMAGVASNPFPDCYPCPDHSNILAR